METTIKISKETKERILSLDLAEKGKTFDMIINDIISYYQTKKKKYNKDYKKWENSFKDWEKEQETSRKLVLWAKSKGFKS